METRKLIVREVVSPGTIRADDDQLYVLKGVPDTEEDFGNSAAAKALVQSMLLNAEILIDTETAKDLPDLPGTEVEAFSVDGQPLTPNLAARVAGALVNHPLK